MMSIRRRRYVAARPSKLPSAALLEDLMEDASAENSSDATLLPKSCRCCSREEISGVRNA